MSAEFGVTRVVLAKLAARRGDRSQAATAAVRLAAAAVVGWLIAPSDLTPSTVGSVVHWGGHPLESAFTATVVGGSVTSFTAHEALFRTYDARALAGLPLNGYALAFDRLKVALRDSLVVGLGVALFAALPAIVAAPQLAGAAAALAFIGAILAPLAGFSFVVLAAVAAAAPNSAVGRAIGAGPSAGAAVYQLAPGAAFAFLASATLLAKLGIEEPLRTLSQTGIPVMTKAAWVALGLPLVSAGALCAVALVSFHRWHDELAARYHELDVPPLDGYSPFANDSRVTDPTSRRRDTPTDTLVRVIAAQLLRSAPLLRPISGLLAAVVALALWSGQELVTPEGAAALLGAWLAFGVRTRARAEALPGDQEYGAASLLAGERERGDARVVAGAAEVAFHVGILSVASLGAGSELLAVALPVIGVGAGTILASRLPRLPPEFTPWAAAAVGGLTSLASTVDVRAAVGCAAVAAAAAAVAVRRRYQPTEVTA